MDLVSAFSEALSRVFIWDRYIVFLYSTVAVCWFFWALVPLQFDAALVASFSISGSSILCWSIKLCLQSSIPKSLSAVSWSLFWAHGRLVRVHGFVADATLERVDWSFRIANRTHPWSWVFILKLYFEAFVGRVDHADPVDLWLCCHPSWWGSPNLVKKNEEQENDSLLIEIDRSCTKKRETGSKNNYKAMVEWMTTRFIENLTAKTDSVS